MIGAALETFGPFLIPVALFAFGVFGYLFLIALTKWGLLGGE
jgi:hypothetical protein